jgi:hypothetical protein
MDKQKHSKEEINKPKLYTVLPNVNLNNNNTTSARCINGHNWTYAGSIHYNLENHPCDCGAVLYHVEPCKCCGQNVSNHIHSNSR